MEETISLGEILDILKKRFILIVSVTMLGTGIASIVTFLLLTPQYRSSAELIVQSKNENSNANLQADVNANVLLINTYKDMIMGDVVLKPVQEKLSDDFNLSMSVSELKEHVLIAQSQNSQMFQIQATSENPKNAMRIANIVAQVFQEQVSNVLNVSKVTITSAAVASETPISPNNTLNIGVGAIIGMVIGIALGFLIELLDKTIKDERFIAEELGLPILGAVEEMSSKDLNRGIAVELTKIVTVKEKSEAPSRVEKRLTPSGRRTRERV